MSQTDLGILYFQCQIMKVATELDHSLRQLACTVIA